MRSEPSRATIASHGATPASLRVGVSSGWSGREGKGPTMTRIMLHGVRRTPECELAADGSVCRAHSDARGAPLQVESVAGSRRCGMTTPNWGSVRRAPYPTRSA